MPVLFATQKGEESENDARCLANLYQRRKHWGVGLNIFDWIIPVLHTLPVHHSVPGLLVSLHILFCSAHKRRLCIKVSKGANIQSWHDLIAPFHLLITRAAEQCDRVTISSQYHHHQHDNHHHHIHHIEHSSFQYLCHHNRCPYQNHHNHLHTESSSTTSSSPPPSGQNKERGLIKEYFNILQTWTNQNIMDVS